MDSVGSIRRSSMIRRPLTTGLSLSVVASIASVAWTAALAVALTALVEERSTATALVALLVLAIVRAALALGAERRLARAANSVVASARNRVIARISMGRVGSTGADLQTMGATVDDLRPWIETYLPARVVATIVPIGVAVLLVLLDPLSALVVAFAGAMLVALLALIGRTTRDRADRRLQELEWLRHLSLDLVRGIPTLRIFGRVDDGADTLRATSRRVTSATMDLLRTAFQTSLVIEWAATAATALVAVEVALRLSEGDLAFGRALLVLMLVPEFFAPLRRLSTDYHAGRMGDAAVARVDGTLAESSDGSSHEVPRASTAPSTPPAIELHDVSVRFDDRTRLHAIDLRIDAGETIGLIGPSGAGKSTIAALIIGTLRPSSGTVRIDGHPIETFDPSDHRSRISIVSQHPVLLAGSIAENIALSDRSASRDRIAEVADRAGVWEFAADLPLGLETEIGPGGARLSGGQRQRLAIARALLRDAPLVVLDEFTAHLDAETERSVIAVMDAHLRDRTAIVIAHRPATLTLADRVVRLVDGRIIDGTDR